MPSTLGMSRSMEAGIVSPPPHVFKELPPIPDEPAASGMGGVVYWELWLFVVCHSGVRVKEEWGWCEGGMGLV